MTKGYSIFIVPEEPQRTKLQGLIDSLREKYQSPAFFPHVTVFGENIAGSIEAAFGIVRKLAETARVFTVEFERVDFSTTFFQCVFIKVKSHVQLFELRTKAERLAGKTPESFMPHLSLIYSNHDLIAREKISLSVTLPIKSFLANKLTLIEFNLGERDPEKLPLSWREIAKIEFSRGKS